MGLNLNPTIFLLICHLAYALCFDVEVTYDHPFSNQHCTRQITIKNKVDSGTFGTVYEGVDTRTGRSVAIKKPQGKNAVELQHEWDNYVAIKAICDIDAAKTVEDSPARKEGIPSVFLIGQVKSSVDAEDCLGSFLLVMELFGESLIAGIKQGTPILPVESVRLFIQMVKSVTYFHQMKVIHGDIKPANFVRGRDGESHRLFVVDAGMARRLGDTTHGGYNVNMFYSSLKCMQILKNTLTKQPITAIRGLDDDLASLPLTFLMISFLHLPWELEIETFTNFIDLDGNGYATVNISWSSAKAPHFDRALEMMSHLPIDIQEAFVLVGADCFGKLLKEMIMFSRTQQTSESVELFERKLLEKLISELEIFEANSHIANSWTEKISHRFYPPPVTATPSSERSNPSNRYIKYEYMSTSSSKKL